MTLGLTRPPGAAHLGIFPPLVEEIAKIVDGLTQISNVVDVNASQQAENFRKILLTLTEGVDYQNKTLDWGTLTKPAQFLCLLPHQPYKVPVCPKGHNPAHAPPPAAAPC